MFFVNFLSRFQPKKHVAGVRIYVATCFCEAQLRLSNRNLDGRQHVFSHFLSHFQPKKHVAGVRGLC